MNDQLNGVAKALSYKFELSVQRVAELCPGELLAVYANPVHFKRMNRVELDALVNDWHDAVQAEAQDIARRTEATNLDAKRLRYFRRRYGPHITVDHLPRGRK